MKIDFLNKFNYGIKKAENNFSNLISNLKMKPLLNKDTVSFTSRIKRTFNSKEEAEKYYSIVASRTNYFLDNNEDIKALETLGYDVSQAPDKEEITINGAYNPVFLYEITGSSNRYRVIDYKKLKINENRLLKNVAKITGKYPEYVFEIFKEKKAVKADKVIEALQNEEYEKALNILEFKTSSDGKNITIDGDYTPVLMEDYRQYEQTLADFGINEKELLSHVTRIKGNAIFESADSINHYIVANGFPYITTDRYSRKLCENNGDALEKLASLEPDFKQKIQDAKELFEKGDNFEALKRLGVPVEKDENGKITVNGNLNFRLASTIADRTFNFQYENIGLDYENILKDVVRVKGSMRLPEFAFKSMEKNIEVDEKIDVSYKILDKLGKIYTTDYKVAEELRVRKLTISEFVLNGNLKPNFKSQYLSYFNGITGENKEFLDELKKRRDEILTSEEIQQKYKVTDTKIANALQKGELVPYAINRNSINYHFHDNYMFDSKDEKNAKFFDRLRRDSEKKLKTEKKQYEKPYLIPAEIKKACLRNKVIIDGINSPMKKYPASALEVLGYGSKEDLIALAPETFSLNFNRYQRYINENDFYDLTKKEMMQLLTISRKRNPAIVNIIDLQRKLGENREDFLKALSEDKINVITDNPLYMTNYSDYQINLFDKKNYEYFKTINNPDFQDFLSQSYRNYKDFKQHNHIKYQEFLDSEPMTKEEAEDFLRKKGEDRQLSTKLKALQKEQAQKDMIEDRSLRLVIAWALSPKTRTVQGGLMDDNIRQLLEKYKSLNAIRKILLLNEINLDKASELTDKITLQEDEKKQILSYFKYCWDVSGTEEWTQGLKDAKEYLKIYRTQGLDAIDNEEVKTAITKWNDKHKKKN